MTQAKNCLCILEQAWCRPWHHQPNLQFRVFAGTGG